MEDACDRGKRRTCASYATARIWARTLSGPTVKGNMRASRGVLSNIVTCMSLFFLVKHSKVRCYTFGIRYKPNVIEP